MSLDFLITDAGGTSLVFALALLALLVGFILWIPPRAARSRAVAPPLPVATPVADDTTRSPDAVAPPLPSGGPSTQVNPIAALYFSSEGRIGRAIYWLSQIPLIALNLLLNVMAEASGASGGVAAFVFLTSVVVLVASVMVGIKRCHDRDKSGWWVLLSVVPVIGWLWAIIELGCLQGTVGPNRFGPDPLAA